MTISSRMPEGFPSECPLCGAATNLEFSQAAADAVCPSCGHLVWLSAQLLAIFQRQFADMLGVEPQLITAETSLAGLGADSIDSVELVMELEEEFDVALPDNAVEGIETIGDLVRAIERRRREG